MRDHYNEIVKEFNFVGDFVDLVPYGYGHINDTYALTFSKGPGQSHRYILQRINHKIFLEPEKLMKNIEGVTEHLRKKILDAGGDPNRETLNIIRTHQGKSFAQDLEGNYWRAYIFIENARTYQLVSSQDHFYNAGTAFGIFQKRLSDYPANTLYETIPDFHDTRKRYSTFADIIKSDRFNRAAGVKQEIEFVERRSYETSIIMKLIDNKEIPLRVTHNDTKFNNVMIDDDTGKGICVIDLDTVMPGSSVFDFGDSIRSGATTGEEDEIDLSKVNLDLGLFESFSHGFLSEAIKFMTPKEIEIMPLAAKMMTLECGIRFLADYINGDTYFKIHRERHNLDRCRTQFKLVTDMEVSYNLMEDIIMKYKAIYRGQTG